MDAVPPSHQLPPSSSGPGLHAPPSIDSATCISLVQNALRVARERVGAGGSYASASNVQQDPAPSSSSAQKPGVTIDLSHRKIANIPPEVIELIKDEIERLALAHNQLTSFADEFAGLPRLRYLNLRSNFLKEFPLALTKLPALEILDVSRNRLRALPQDFGLLMSLKVLSMSKNKLNVLPTYIGEMSDLKILKLDHNPIVFPPKEVWETEESDRDLWLDNVKRFLRQHSDRASTQQDTESGSSSDEGGGDHDFPPLNPSISRTPSFDSETTESTPPTVRGQLSTIRPLRVNGAGDVQTRVASGSSSNREGGLGKGLGHSRRPKHPPNMVNNTASPGLSSSPLPSGRPQTPQSAASTHSSSSQTSMTERHRSNSESTVSTKSKRLGMAPPPRGTKPNYAPEKLRPVDEVKSYKHTRGYSHDSVIDGGNPNSRSPTDTERRPGQYFRRLSSLPEHKRTSLSSARVGEAARGILYAMSTLKKPAEQYVQSVGDPHGPHQKVERALYNGNIHVGSLVSALESYEEKDDEPAVQKVIDACHACVAAFGQVLAMLQSSLKELVLRSPAPEARYMRTLLLMSYGAHVEIMNSYSTLKPLLLAHLISENMTADGGSGLRQQPIAHVLRFPQNASSSASASDSNISTMIAVAPPLATPRSSDSSFPIPATPGTQPSTNASHSDSGFDQDGALYQKFLAATSAATQMLPQIDRDIKAAGSQNLPPHTILKLREVSSLCMSGYDAARRLSNTRWEAIQNGDPNERKRFWDETNKFTNLVIGIAELIKSVTQEYAFSKPTLSAVGTVVRPTKDLYIVMNGSGFRNLAECQPPPPHSGLSPSSGFGFQSMSVQHQVMPATPLSAALGPAAQATLPQSGLYANGSPNLGLGGYGGLSSRTATLVSSHHPTMTSTTSELAMSFATSSSSSQPGALGMREKASVKPI